MTLFVNKVAHSLKGSYHIVSTCFSTFPIKSNQSGMPRPGDFGDKEPSPARAFAGEGIRCDPMSDFQKDRLGIQKGKRNLKELKGNSRWGNSWQIPGIPGHSQSWNDDGSPATFPCAPPAMPEAMQMAEISTSGRNYVKGFHV